MEQSFRELASKKTKEIELEGVLNDPEHSRGSHGSADENAAPLKPYDPNYISTEARAILTQKLKKRDQSRLFMASSAILNLLSVVALVVCLILTENIVEKAYDLHLPLTNGTTSMGLFDITLLYDVSMAVYTGEPEFQDHYNSLLIQANQTWNWLGGYVILPQRASEQFDQRLVYDAMLFNLTLGPDKNQTRAQELLRSEAYQGLSAENAAGFADMTAQIVQRIDKSKLENQDLKVVATVVLVLSVINTLLVACHSAYGFRQMKFLESMLDEVVVKNFERISNNFSENNAKLLVRYNYYLASIQQLQLRKATRLYEELQRKLMNYLNVLQTAVSDSRGAFLRKQVVDLENMMKRIRASYPKILETIGDAKQIEASWKAETPKHVSAFSSRAEHLAKLVDNNPDGERFQKYYLFKCEVQALKLKNLLFVLNDPDTLPFFARFLENEHSEENLLFWTETRHYAAIDDPEIRMKKAKHIFEKYVSTGDMTVNLPASIRRNLETHFASFDAEAATKTLFDAARSSIEQLMLNDSFLRFMQSPARMGAEEALRAVQDRCLTYAAPVYDFLAAQKQMILKHMDACISAQQLKLAGHVYFEGASLFPAFSAALFFPIEGILATIQDEVKELESRLASQDYASHWGERKGKRPSRMDGSGRGSFSMRQEAKDLQTKIISQKKEWILALVRFLNIYTIEKAAGSKMVQIDEALLMLACSKNKTSSSSSASSAPSSRRSSHHGPGAHSHDEHEHDEYLGSASDDDHDQSPLDVSPLPQRITDPIPIPELERGRSEDEKAAMRQQGERKEEAVIVGETSGLMSDAKHDDHDDPHHHVEHPFAASHDDHHVEHRIIIEGKKAKKEEDLSACSHMHLSVPVVGLQIAALYLLRGVRSLEEPLKKTEELIKQVTSSPSLGFEPSLRKGPIKILPSKFLSPKSRAQEKRDSDKDDFFVY